MEEITEQLEYIQMLEMKVKELQREICLLKRMAGFSVFKPLCGIQDSTPHESKTEELRSLLQDIPQDYT